MNSLKTKGVVVGRRVAAVKGRFVAVVAAFAVVGCSGVLEVDNPNNVVDEALNNPAAVNPIVNGAGGSVVRALNSLIAPYGAATDELTWSGSRDGFKQLDDGNVSDPSNEYVDAANFNVSEARYLTDEAIGRVSKFDKDGTLLDKNQLGRVYLYGAVIYTTIGDMFDDYVIRSFRTVAAANEGEAKISVVYDTAVSYTTKGLAVATDAALKAELTALRARAKFSKALWSKLNPSGATPASPYVNDAGAVADAQAALALMPSPDFRFDMQPVITNLGNPSSGFEINQRLELRAGDVFVVPDNAGTRWTSVRLRDPVDNVPDPALTQNLDRCCKVSTANQDGRYIPYTVLSAREMHLIIAEAALAAGNTAGFTTSINAVRALKGSSAWSSSSAVTARNLLIHERAVNLFMQGRRLADLYRFGLKSDKWATSSTAYRRAGCFFSIPITERQSNTLVTDQPSCAP